MRRLVPFCLALTIAAPSRARADDAARATELLGQILTGPHDGRAAAAAALLELGPDAVPAVKEFLFRDRRSTEDERRAVLGMIEAAVPDARGRFIMPKRDPSEKKPEEDLDWLPALLALEPATPALGEVIADVAAIRALAASESFEAGDVILQWAFTADGLAYRDECGRYLRAMAPWSLPGLIRGSIHLKGKHADLGRYARYQLQRLDREMPDKAISTAPDDATKIAVLKAYDDVHHPDAVLAVLDTTNDVSPAVRAQARATWYGYVTGPPPPPAPKRKLSLPGGKFTEEEMPLWLTYREWAEIELRERYEEVFGRKPERRAKLKAMSDELFAHYDAQRAERLQTRAARAAELAGAGQHAEAAAVYDGVLAEQPDHPARADMAPTYAALGDALTGERKWRAAAIAYGKAHALAPDAPEAKRAQANQHYAMGKAIAAGGGDGEPELRRALEIDPGHPRAAAALEGDDPDPVADGGTAPGGQPRWLLFGGAAAGLLALALAIAAARKRS